MDTFTPAPIKPIRHVTVGVISDTHGLLRRDAVAALRDVDLIVHAGDIGDPEVLERLRAIAPTVAVRGNVDTSAWASALSRTEVVEVGGLHLYVLHDLSALDLDPKAAGFAAVISGHTHRPHAEVRDGILYLNPGAAGPRRFRLPVALARLHVNDSLLSHEIITMTQNTNQPKVEPSSIKALVFDVFGTVVDWRTSVAQEVQQLAKGKGLNVDGAQFADVWRGRYAPSMNRVRTGELPWTKLDDLHRMMLNDVVKELGVTGLTEAELSTLNHAWRRLRPWPDAVGGLTRLKTRFTIAPLSNGNIALMTALAKHGGLPWDCILGAELVRRYKPDVEVYRSVAGFLDVDLSQVVMVAAHLGDLRAAKGAGLRTAFVPRPQELGPRGKPDLQPDASVDVFATDFNDLARQLGT